MPARSQYRRLLSHLPVEENPLKANFRPHQTAAWARRKFPQEIFRNCFKFAFVRNPYDWVVSYYTFIKTDQRHHRHKTVSNMSFIEFQRWQQSRGRAAMRWHFDADRYANILVDFIARFENLENDLQTVFGRPGIVGAKLPHKNKNT